MAHHGMTFLHGINSMCKSDTKHEGRFGRIFPHLNPNYNPPNELRSLGAQKIGAQNGPMNGGKARNPSTTIPMGFVFLGQFIDHDITLDVTSQLDKVNDPNATRNFRTPALDLDCIYGAGPEASNFLYRKNGTQLLTGSDGTALGSQTDAHRKNDLVRNSDGTAIIGDPRNDENRIISQLQLAFIKFHNRVANHLKNEDPNLKGAELFEEARRTVTWHYHWIIINEYLPLIVGKPMVNDILGRGRALYKPHKAFIPIEFSAAAYRFGHSLAPQKLKVQVGQTNDFELFGKTLGFGFAPINDDLQVVEWPTMFDMNSTAPAQKTDKLDTKLPSDLLNLPFIPVGNEKSLATRNLLRGQSFLIPSGENIAEKIGVAAADIRKVHDYVTTNIGNIDLSNGIPLWYYILVEAECIGRQDAVGSSQPGEGLGPVGGRIVAETLIGLIELDSTSYLGSNRNWTPTLKPSGTFTMSDLLSF